MPRDAAGRLVGSLAHPLNRPRFDPSTGRVVAGYGVLPAEGQLPPDGGHAVAVRRDAGDLGRYRPLFDGGLRHLHGPLRRRHLHRQGDLRRSTPSRRPPATTFPENRILSHDLIEGNFARCGLLSDTELFDDFPARYNAYARREHRWVRGDWQLLPWLGSRVPLASGRVADGEWRGGGRSGPPQQSAAAPRALEAAGQPAPQPGPARAAAAPGAGLDGAARLAVGLDGGGPGLFVLPLFQTVLSRRDRQHPHPGRWRR